MSLSPDKKVGSLAAARLFEGVDAAAMERIAGLAVEVDFAPGHVIARQGDIGSGFFVITTGSVRVTRAGREIAELGPGDFFGELSVLDGRPRTAQVSAIEATTCLALSTWDFETVVKEEPGVALAILRGLASRLRDLTEADRH